MDLNRFSARTVFLTLVTLFCALVFFQHSLDYFPADYSHRRLPPWAPLSYPILTDYIRPQAQRHWILLGDSTFHGDTTFAKPAVGYRLSESGTFINLTNPSLAFPVEAWLLNYWGNRYPDKSFIVELNPKWFVSSWVPEKFEQLSTDVQARNFKQRILALLAFDDLRFKIQYRWLNERTLTRLLEVIQHRSPDLAKIPFAAQEMMLENRPSTITAKEPIDPLHLEEMGRMAEGDPETFAHSPGFAALLAALIQHRGHVGVLITPFDPEAVAHLTVAQQAHYQRTIGYFENALTKAGIPHRTAHIPAEKYLNYNHYLPAGHDQCMQEILTLCRQIIQ